MRLIPRSIDSRFSFRKKAFYGLLVAALFFVGLEILLASVGVRLTVEDRDPYVGFERSIPLFVEHEHRGEVYLETAWSKLQYFNAQRFPKRKASNAFRVFCVGGSTTYGRPYNDSTSYVGWLRELLPLADGGKQWEVINAGGISYASYRVAAVVDELCNYSPDLFVVYTGHNEFLEERTYRDFRNRTDSFRFATAWLNHTRVFSLAQQLFGSVESDSNARHLLPTEVDAVLDHTVGPESYHRDDGLRSKILEHFEFNLRRIVTTARSVGADVLLITPCANFKDFSPFKSEFLGEVDEQRETEWIELFLQAIKLEALGDFTQALETLQTAALIDNGRAELHFQLGQLLFQLGRFPEAQVALQRAVEFDVCPLRAISEIQVIVERVAVAERVPLIDFNAILQNDCLREYGHAVLGNEYFDDHVHPNIETHRLLAIAIQEALIQKRVVTPNDRWRDEAVALASRRIESRIDPEFQARALTNLAQVLSWAGKQSEAGPLAARAVNLRAEHGLREEPESLFYLAVHLESEGSTEQATTLYERVLQHVPNQLQVRKRLGSLLVDQLRFAEAKTHIAEAVRLDPVDATSHHLLGVVLLELQLYREAVESLQQATRLDPSNAAILDDLAIANARVDSKP